MPTFNDERYSQASMAGNTITNPSTQPHVHHNHHYTHTHTQNPSNSAPFRAQHPLNQNATPNYSRQPQTVVLSSQGITRGSW
jgi:hypothetical protein